MLSFLSRALWVKAAVARARGDVIAVDEAISLARAIDELPLLRSLLALAGSQVADQVAEEIALTIPDVHLRYSFRNTAPL
jgi:hypothetical protein